MNSPHVFTIPVHCAFADELVEGLVRRYGTDRLALARGVILLPTNRARRALNDAFVRASAGGLLLPRMVTIGDPELDEAIGAALDPADDAQQVPPAIAPLARRMILARLVSEERVRTGQAVDAAEAVRLAGELAHTLDELLVEEVAPSQLHKVKLAGELTDHWLRALDLFKIVLERWPKELTDRGVIDLTDRRARLLTQTAERWRQIPPRGFVCAAGIATSAPAIARLLRVVSELPDGLVVLPGLATEMAESEWLALGPHVPDPVTGVRKRSIETHPQFHLKRLLDRIGIARSDVMAWRDGADHGTGRARARAIENALAPAQFTGKWTTLPPEARELSGIRAVELATPAEEAQAIALALREAAETPGKTAALVTPDRSLARRVAAHCARWGIAIDDSAGRPLSILPPGTLLAALAEAAAQHFAPTVLLALLKHPLVRRGPRRLAWLDGVRALDLALRGPRPAPGLDGIDSHLGEQDGRDAHIRKAAANWWREAKALLDPLERCFARGPQSLVDLLAVLRETANALCGDSMWAEPAGRALADFLSELESEARWGPKRVDPDALAALLDTLMGEIAVRPPQGGHPRLAIYGLIEARLQRADLMILGGLNEGVWPGLMSPDPWLAPRIRADLNLPGLERRIGLVAHDLASALGGAEVLLTRARRDARAPVIASRFWLRLEAMSGGLDRLDALEHWTRTLDRPTEYIQIPRPAPVVAPQWRPLRISVTEVDRLKADPFAFYARRVLGLMPLDVVDADPSAAWRGTAVHAILESWANEDGCRPDKLMGRARAMLADARTHPLLRALWQPRLIAAVEWIAETMGAQLVEGRHVLAAECAGKAEIAGVLLTGKADRIDRLSNGGLGIVDYKTGKPPSARAVAAGFSLQLGLIGAIAERGGFQDIAGRADAFDYWSLAKKNDAFGYIDSPVDPDGKRNKVPTRDFVAIAVSQFSQAASNWLTGNAPFTAKLNPQYAPYAEYDQLMRLDEWYGRG